GTKIIEPEMPCHVKRKRVADSAPSRVSHAISSGLSGSGVVCNSFGKFHTRAGCINPVCARGAYNIAIAKMTTTKAGACQRAGVSHFSFSESDADAWTRVQ